MTDKQIYESQRGVSPTHPRQITPSVSDEDYDVGYIYRYFCKKVNDENSNILEIDKDQYDMLVSYDKSINGPLYKAIRVIWKVSGIKDVVNEENKRRIEDAERDQKFKNLTKKIRNSYTKFYKYEK